MLSKNDLPFSYENLRKSYLADLQKTYENLTTNLGKILRKSLRSFENQEPEQFVLCFHCHCVLWFFSLLAMCTIISFFMLFGMCICRILTKITYLLNKWKRRHLRSA